MRGQRVISGGLVALSCEGLYLAPNGQGDKHVHGLKTAEAWAIEASERSAPLRVGFEAALTKSLSSRVRWHGLGPHESYPDRKAGARVGCWDGSVAEQTFKYVRPQENGNKLETRWMALSDPEGGAGLLVASLGAPISMQCHHYAMADFDCQPDSTTPNVRHGALLKERPFTTLCIDGAHAGVGGIDSWGSQPLSQHRLSLEAPIEWAFVLRTFGAAEAAEGVAKLAKELVSGGLCVEASRF